MQRDFYILHQISGKSLRHYLPHSNFEYSSLAPTLVRIEVIFLEMYSSDNRGIRVLNVDLRVRAGWLML